MRPAAAQASTSRAYLCAPRAIDTTDHRLYWQKENAKPLVGLFRQDMLPLSRFVAHVGEGLMRPEDIRPEAWMGLYEESFQRAGLMWGDLMWWASPLNGFPWVEAIAGCPVKSSRATGSAWANPHPAVRQGLTEETLEEVLPGLAYDPGNPWLQKLLECTRLLVRQAGGRFPVSPGIMRGASDLVAALLGQSQFCLAQYDYPQAVASLAERCTELWLQVIAAQLECIPIFAGGYANAGLWAPGPCPVYQEDASVLVSAPAFQRFFADAGCRVWAEYPYGILHLHSAGLHISPGILERACPPVVEINLDPAGPSVESLLPTLERIRQRTRLEVLGSQSQVRQCIETLEPSGTAYWVLEETLEADSDPK